MKRLPPSHRHEKVAANSSSPSPVPATLGSACPGTVSMPRPCQELLEKTGDSNFRPIPGSEVTWRLAQATRGLRNFSTILSLAASLAICVLAIMLVATRFDRWPSFLAPLRARLDGTFVSGQDLEPPALAKVPESRKSPTGRLPIDHYRRLNSPSISRDHAALAATTASVSQAPSETATSRLDVAIMTALLTSSEVAHPVGVADGNPGVDTFPLEGVDTEIATAVSKVKLTGLIQNTASQLRRDAEISIDFDKNVIQPLQLARVADDVIASSIAAEWVPITASMRMASYSRSTNIQRSTRPAFLLSRPLSIEPVVNFQEPHSVSANVAHTASDSAPRDLFQRRLTAEQLRQLQAATEQGNQATDALRTATSESARPLARQFYSQLVAASEILLPLLRNPVSVADQTRNEQPYDPEEQQAVSAALGLVDRLVTDVWAFEVVSLTGRSWIEWSGRTSPIVVLTGVVDDSIGTPEAPLAVTIVLQGKVALRVRVELAPRTSLRNFSPGAKVAVLGAIAESGENERFRVTNAIVLGPGQ